MNLKNLSDEEILAINYSNFSLELEDLDEDALLEREKYGTTNAQLHSRLDND